MSYLNPHTHNLDSADGAAKLVADIAVLGHTADVLDEVAAERQRQDARWGEQNHPDGTAEHGHHDVDAAVRAKVACAFLATHGGLTWRHVLIEEVYEAFAENDPTKLRAELIQVAAVAAAWIEAIDRRTAATDA